MTINPYDTLEPFLWAGDYLVYRGKVVGLVKLAAEESMHQPWLAVPLMTNHGELRSDRDYAVSIGFRSATKPGAMLRLQDWLGELISRNAVALETFMRSDPTVRESKRET